MNDRVPHGVGSILGETFAANVRKSVTRRFRNLGRKIAFPMIPSRKTSIEQGLIVPGIVVSADLSTPDEMLPERGTHYKTQFCTLT